MKKRHKTNSFSARFIERRRIVDWISTFLEKKLEHVSSIIVCAFNRGNKILLFGNGGSAADAQHLAAEFVNRFMIERVPLPAIALTTDSSIITAIANDYSFDLIFSKQVEALANEGDVVIGISTSGTSPNVIKGLQTARTMKATTILLTKVNVNNLFAADIIVGIPTNITPLIQEAHIMIGHILCEMVDEKFIGYTDES
jgi:D-sedoheptulose 7-phosphate isomerase